MFEKAGRLRTTAEELLPELVSERLNAGCFVLFYFILSYSEAV